jgi:hypothetical protein
MELGMRRQRNFLPFIASVVAVATPALGLTVTSGADRPWRNQRHRIDPGLFPTFNTSVFCINRASCSRVAGAAGLSVIDRLLRLTARDPHPPDKRPRLPKKIGRASKLFKPESRRIFLSSVAKKTQHPCCIHVNSIHVAPVLVYLY